MPEIKDGKPVISYKKTTVNASTSNVVIDSIDSSVFKSFKWTVSVYDSVSLKRKLSDILVVLVDANVNHTEVIVGDNINNTIDVDLNSGNVRLLITNNESNSLEIDIVALKF